MTTTYEMLPINRLHPHPHNVRRALSDVEDLAQSIRTEGLHQPLVVAPAVDGDGWTVVMGHRRLAACQTAGLTEVPCVIRPDLDGEAVILRAMLAENLARTDLTPTEEGDAVQALLDLDVPPSAIAKSASRTVRHVKERAKLAAQPPRVREAVDDGQLSITDAIALDKFADDDRVQGDLIAAIGTPGFSWRLEEARARREWDQALAVLRTELAARGATEVDPLSDGAIFADVFMEEPDDVTTAGVVWAPTSFSHTSPPAARWLRLSAPAAGTGPETPEGDTRPPRPGHRPTPGKFHDEHAILREHVADAARARTEAARAANRLPHTRDTLQLLIQDTLRTRLAATPHGHERLRALLGLDHGQDLGLEEMSFSGMVLALWWISHGVLGNEAPMLYRDEVLYVQLKRGLCGLAAIADYELTPSDEELLAVFNPATPDDDPGRSIA